LLSRKKILGKKKLSIYTDVVLAAFPVKIKLSSFSHAEPAHVCTKSGRKQ